MDGIEINISSGNMIADIYKEQPPSIQQIMRRTSYQARLGKKLDNIVRKVTDNNIRLASQPVDMIRIKVNRDPISQDLISRTVVSTEIIPIIFPTMEKVPLRRLTREGEDDVLVPNLYQFYEEQYWTIYTPAEIRLDEDDILLRLIYDPYSNEPNILCTQVKESLGTIGYSSFIYFEYKITLYDEELPDQVINIIKQANTKREELGW